MKHILSLLSNSKLLKDSKTSAKTVNLLLTKKQIQEWKYSLNASFKVRETPSGLFLYPCDPPLTKIYIEPTTHCNLNCATCMRHSWEESGGSMQMATFKKLITDLKQVNTLKSMAFWGIGEPMKHDGIIEMIQLAKKLGVQTELITNGMLLTPDLSQKIIKSGLDVLIVSIDGTTPESYSTIRSGADLKDLIQTIKSLNAYKLMLERRTPDIGIEFVVSRRNIDELPNLVDIARQIQASIIYVSNILPYTLEAKKDILYWLSAGNTYPPSRFSEWVPEILLPRIDKRPENLKPLAEFLLKTDAVWQTPPHLSGAQGYCPFVGKGSLSVRWDGEISPCIPLMHSHHCFVLDREKTIKKYSVGNVNQDSIDCIWKKDEYVKFRQRVIDFDFAPCNQCDCELAESNEADCFGTPFPACGDCLWARRIVICP
jgi:MoaA/NifB/PqqE/SkfB family radical SAM enzyme